MPTTLMPFLRSQLNHYWGTPKWSFYDSLSYEPIFNGIMREMGKVIEPKWNG